VLVGCSQTCSPRTTTKSTSTAASKQVAHYSTVLASIPEKEIAVPCCWFMLLCCSQWKRDLSASDLGLWQIAIVTSSFNNRSCLIACLPLKLDKERSRIALDVGRASSAHSSVHSSESGPTTRHSWQTLQPVLKSENNP